MILLEIISSKIPVTRVVSGADVAAGGNSASVSGSCARNYAGSRDCDRRTVEGRARRPAGKEPNGKTIVLFHGKAFGCYYFRNVIEALTGAGYRVVAPDQIGWGKSPKPDIHYSFQLLAANTAALLDHLGVQKTAVLGHSTGGMTAVRFTPD
jgi:pimeloyl-ACP methyl ester carboxylesterase